MPKFFVSLVVGIITTLTAAAASVDTGAPAAFTPYDAYMGPVRQVLGGLKGRGVSMERVRELMVKGFGFRYVFDEPYVATLPQVTEARRSGDCKDKALWLAKQMGDENVRFVVGKARRVSNMSHAWLLWKKDGRWWILDCTNNSQPVAADTAPRNEYVPLYSWSKHGIYRHASTRVPANSAIARKERSLRR